MHETPLNEVVSRGTKPSSGAGAINGVEQNGGAPCQPHPGTRANCYRCSLPGLAEFTAAHCEGTGKVRHKHADQELPVSGSGAHSHRKHIRLQPVSQPDRLKIPEPSQILHQHTSFPRRRESTLSVIPVCAGMTGGMAGFTYDLHLEPADGPPQFLVRARVDRRFPWQRVIIQSDNKTDNYGTRPFQQLSITRSD